MPEKKKELKSVFLKKIEFTKYFPPFKEGTEIEFNDGMKDIIKFYLKSKGFDSKKAENVANRMKINVIVGENGTGKSRLLNIINCKKGYEKTKDGCENKNLDKNILNNVQIDLKNKDIIIDNPTIFENINITDNFYDLFFGTSLEENKLFWKEILESFFMINYEEVYFKAIVKPVFISIMRELPNKVTLYIKILEKISKFLEPKEKENTHILDLFILFIYISYLYEIIYFAYPDKYGLLENQYYLDIKEDFNKKFCELHNKINDYLTTINNKENVIYNKVSLRNSEDIIPNIGKISDELMILRNELHYYFQKNKTYFIFNGKNISFYNKNNKLLGKEELNNSYKLTLLDSSVIKISSFNNIIINNNLQYSNFSSGEKAIIARFAKIYTNLLKGKDKGQKNFIILIDEPDIHLHLDWQKQYIQKLVDVFGNLLKDIDDISLHFIIATHSPFLLSDVPAENVILLQKDKDKKCNETGNYCTKVTDWWGNEFGKDNNILNIKDVLDSLNKLKNGKGS